jgi:short-subunit dehydrogenase
MLILGAGSDLGQALAAAASSAGISVLMAARQPQEKLQASKAMAGLSSSFHLFDVNQTNRHSSFLDDLPFLPDIVVCLVGLLGDHFRAEHDLIEAEMILRTNFLSPALILAEVAKRMERRGYGAIVGVSSVAGDRGRAENYYYGAAKAGLAAYLSGMAQRFGNSAIRIVTVKPGPLQTKMTAGMNLGRMQRLFVATPKQIAPALLRACLRARGTVYLPWYWRPIMAILRAIPEPIFLRMRFGN